MNNTRIEVKEFINYKKTMDIKKYQKWADDFLMKNFQMGLKIPIKWNGRLKNSYGRFHSLGYPHQFPLFIDLNSDFFASNEISNTIENNYGVLGHELVHYALCSLGKEFYDGSYTFENKLIELNLPSSPKYKNQTHNNFFTPKPSVRKVTIWETENGKDTLKSYKYHRNESYILKDKTGKSFPKIRETYYEVSKVAI